LLVLPDAPNLTLWKQILPYRQSENVKGPRVTFELLVLLLGQFLCRMDSSIADHLPYEWQRNVLLCPMYTGRSCLLLLAPARNPFPDPFGHVEVCLEEAGLDLAGANLEAEALNSSIGMSMQSLLEKVEQFSSALQVEK
jgi:hypothetical protein